MRFVLHTTLTVVLLCQAGCGQDSGDTRKTGGDETKTDNQFQLLPPEEVGVRIVLEAETGEVEPVMVVEDFQPYKHPDMGDQVASGGRCISVPKGANGETEEEKQNPKGKVSLKFKVPKDGTYYIYPRVWWKDSCGNSFGMQVNDGPTLIVTDMVYEHWHWIKLKEDPRSNKPRGFKLKEGEHTLVFTNREDDAKLDQVYITDSPADQPTGIMQGK